MQTGSKKDEKIIYRYRESSFEKGEQVAVLGVVEKMNDDQGNPVDVVGVVSRTRDILF
jgi:hypothetical protein